MHRLDDVGGNTAVEHDASYGLRDGYVMQPGHGVFITAQQVANRSEIDPPRHNFTHARGHKAGKQANAVGMRLVHV